ncbi:hypothetical protein L485_20015 [Sphingobium baderi LL03]|uniref:Uncharacterized protein n=1 Tax=Sphingobium baderi LL03 TaxID=1114964 RepID=T0GDB6_9SPHN|nr:hypothetical protein L485_20015 [Sphingobium baderi LL03]
MFRAIVGVHEHDVISLAPIIQRVPYILHADLDARIVKWIAREMAEIVPVPVHDLRHDFRNDHLGVVIKEVKHHPQRVAQTQAADQNLSGRAAKQAQRLLREKILRLMTGTAHQFHAVISDFIEIVFPKQYDFVTGGNAGSCHFGPDMHAHP